MLSIRKIFSLVGALALIGLLMACRPQAEPAGTPLPTTDDAPAEMITPEATNPPAATPTETTPPPANGLGNEENIDMAEPPQLPAACQLQDPAASRNAPFVNVRDGYCFQYPALDGFHVKDVLSPGIAAVWGPPLSPGLEPVRAGLSIVKREPAGGRSLDAVVAAVVDANPEAAIVDPNATFAGEPAQVVEGLPGMMDSRLTILIHDEAVFEISLVPLTAPSEYEAGVDAQREQLWEATSGSFSWLPDDLIDRFAGCPAPETAGPLPLSPFFSVEHGFCLVYPSHYLLSANPERGLTFFLGPAVDPTIPEPVRPVVQVGVIDDAGARTLEEVVDDIAAEFPGVEITRQPAALDGEPALIVTGLPSRLAGRDLFAIHDGRVFQVRIEPTGLPELVEEVERSWKMVVDSFHFVR